MSNDTTETSIREIDDHSSSDEDEDSNDICQQFRLAGDYFLSGDADGDDVDIIFLLLLLEVMNQKIDTTTTLLQGQLRSLIHQESLLNRRLPQAKQRKSWHEFTEEISAEHFRRMFRMSTVIFNNLCMRIIDKIGETIFRSENYIQDGGMSKKKTAAAQSHTGGYIAGEIKVAVTIRLLLGGSYLDLVPLFGIVHSHIYKIFDSVVRWILYTFEFPLVSMLRQQQWKFLHELAQRFAEKSGGAFYGAFGALDGLALRIISPRQTEVPDPGNY